MESKHRKKASLSNKGNASFEASLNKKPHEVSWDQIKPEDKTEQEPGMFDAENASKPKLIL